MRTIPPIEGLLFGQTRARILSLLYGATDERLYVRQIARETETSAGTIQRELSLLTGAGLIERSVLGMQVFYRAHPEFPAFAELRALLAKTAGLPPASGQRGLQIDDEQGLSAEQDSTLPAELL